MYHEYKTAILKLLLNNQSETTVNKFVIKYDKKDQTLEIFQEYTKLCSITNYEKKMRLFIYGQDLNNNRAIIIETAIEIYAELFYTGKI